VDGGGGGGGARGGRRGTWRVRWHGVAPELTRAGSGGRHAVLHRAGAGRGRRDRTSAADVYALVRYRFYNQRAGHPPATGQ